MTDESMHYTVNDIILSWFRDPMKPMLDFKRIMPLLPKLIPFLDRGQHGLTIQELYYGLYTFRFDFWSWCFEHREILTKQQLLFLWRTCFGEVHCGGCVSSFFDLPRSTYFLRTKDLPQRVPRNGKKLAESAITNPLLIDSPLVCRFYCLVKKPGYEKLRHLVSLRCGIGIQMAPAIVEAVQEDSWPAFAIGCDLRGSRLNYSLLMAIIGNGACEIFRHLLEQQMITPDIISLQELCCLLAGQMEDEIAIPFLEILEHHSPGILAKTRDFFGRNLLWYTMHNLNTIWFRSDFKLASFLLQNNCSPQNTNQLGIAWQDANEYILTLPEIDQYDLMLPRIESSSLSSQLLRSWPPPQQYRIL